MATDRSEHQPAIFRWKCALHFATIPTLPYSLPVDKAMT